MSKLGFWVLYYSSGHIRKGSQQIGRLGVFRQLIPYVRWTIAVSGYYVHTYKITAIKMWADSSQWHADDIIADGYEIITE